MSAEHPRTEPDFDALWLKRACPAGRRIVETSDDTDAAADRLIQHIESCEACLAAVLEALDEYLG